MQQKQAKREWQARKYRWEAHIWVREMGRQVYLGGYEHAEHAAEAYDVAALKCKGFKVKTNFDVGRQILLPLACIARLELFMQEHLVHHHMHCQHQQQVCVKMPFC